MIRALLGSCNPDREHGNNRRDKSLDSIYLQPRNLLANLFFQPAWDHEFTGFSRLALLSQVRSHLQSYPCPGNLTGLWNFGFLLGLTLTLQILSGLLLTSLFSPDTEMAFNTIQWILREVPSGWLFRYIHASLASGIFILAYIHLARGILYVSFRYLPLVWLSGLVLFLLLIVTAFLGYVLPWGQMSFWAATVITNLLSGLPGVVSWLTGGYYVANPTLKRFMVLHFVLPFAVIGLVVVHVLYLHLSGSSSPLNTSALKVSFFPVYLFSDLKGLWLVGCGLGLQVFFGVLEFSHPDNSCRVDRFVTPLQIVPEWYFLSFYAILKSIPAKTCGLIIMLASLQSLWLLPEARNSRFRGINSTSSLTSWLLLLLYALGILGNQLPQTVYLAYGRIFILAYFTTILLILGLAD